MDVSPEAAVIARAKKMFDDSDNFEGAFTMLKTFVKAHGETAGIAAAIDGLKEGQSALELKALDVCGRR
jgi:hypothetical protein